MAPTWQELQSSAHTRDYDYTSVSPHLAHKQLREMISEHISSAVEAAITRRGSCTVLEIGAGHGHFTSVALDAGARAVVTEMSQDSAAYLEERYRGCADVEVVHDATGERAFELASAVDVIMCVSLLHHIPDYLTFVSRLSSALQPGSALVTFQDPMWYPRRRRASFLATKVAYFIWRIGRGDLRAGLATRVRRLRGKYDENLAADMVEYHVVRSGVDEERLVDVLKPLFRDVSLITYWSTQSTILQQLGERIGLVSEFGIVAAGRVG